MPVNNVELWFLYQDYFRANNFEKYINNVITIANRLYNTIPVFYKELFGIK